MPSEGEALIAWMRENENRWRYPSIQALLDADPYEEAEVMTDFATSPPVRCCSTP